MGDKKKSLMIHCEELTVQLGKAWDVIASVLTSRIRLQSINLQSGDLVVVHGRDGAGYDEMQVLSHSIARFTRRLDVLYKDVAVVLIPHGVALDVIDPKLMDEAGWQRKIELVAPATTAG